MGNPTGAGSSQLRGTIAPVKVAQVIDSLVPGGAERSLVSIAPHLVDKGVDIVVVPLVDVDGLSGLLTAAGIPMRVSGGRTRPARVKALADVITDLRPDLVHTTLFEADIAGRLAAAWRRVPVVTTLASTSYGPEHLARPGIRRHRLLAAQTADAVTARLARRFHAVSGAVAETMSKRLHIPPGRIDVVWRGRDPAALGTRDATRRQRARRLLGIEDGDPLLVMLSRHETDKGIDVAIDAVAHLRTQLPAVQLVVAGQTGGATAALHRQIDDAGLGEVVSLLGPRDDYLDILCAGDVFVASSRREGLPGAVLEAMALGVPIVASDLPGVREAVGSTDTARLVSVGGAKAFASAVAETLTDLAGSATRAKHAQERFRAYFTIDHAAEGMHAFYERALGASS